MLIEVSVVTPQEIIFEGKARSVILPGERGVLEVLSCHKSLISRLVSGVLSIDGKNLLIQRGFVKVVRNKVTAIVEKAI